MRNASAPYKFADTARAVRVKKKKQNKKILRKQGLHEAPPKPQFDEYYGISASNNSKIVKVNLIF